MALDYTLKMQTHLSLDEIARIAVAAKTGKFEANKPYPLDIGCVSVGRCSKLSEKIIGENLGFYPNVNVLFNLDIDFDRDTGVTFILQSVIALIQNTPSDLILLFNGEDIILLRSDGKLLLNSNSDFWSIQSRLDEIQLPYRFKEIPLLV
jgi:hypothetical protein